MIPIGPQAQIVAEQEAYSRGYQDAIRDLGPLDAQGWISVDDQLPDKSGPYLVAVESWGEVNRRVLWYDKRGYWGGGCNVRWWMHLPQLPESEAD